MSKIFIVGTPIGNLADITYRAVETLKFVDIVACEDTRVTAKLLNYYNIKMKMIVHNKDNEKDSAKGIVEMLTKDDINLALVSDAGMPLVNDPGFELIKLARKNDIPIEIIPGVNAAITAFALSGLSNTFIYLGFPKEKENQRLNQIKEFKSEHSYVFYVATNKIEKFLLEIESIWKDQIELFLAREMTKIYEQFYCGTPQEVINQLHNSSTKGEFTLVAKIKEIKKVKVNKYIEFSKVK
ncbi:16S rRNA (cytidine(1402)-2'-O)-methyltransferase [Mycoplasmopsis primatum]|uniref:16S rRNA (cytidine(1402)-2'-O)-methyltransferase n=1 Tax=Mycoplasmopsis primatum TaxID=55604 RepID=UPI000495905D|nr:16S rRNA (cytidine(1402)-2'-O)-methyltransferase [Mycoplasmopsis primatum]